MMPEIFVARAQILVNTTFAQKSAQIKKILHYLKRMAQFKLN